MQSEGLEIKRSKCEEAVCASGGLVGDVFLGFCTEGYKCCVRDGRKQKVKMF